MECAGFLFRIAATCAAFYILFLCRALGAGDIKLMALCTGILGAWDGIYVIFLGMLFAAGWAAWRLWKEGQLWERMQRFTGFVIQTKRTGKLAEYPGSRDPANGIRLGPLLFLGYCLFLIL